MRRFPAGSILRRHRERLDCLSPDMEALKRISAEIGCGGYYVFVLSPDEEILVHGRMFGPAGGVPEDPVTGNANGPLGGYLIRFSLIDAKNRRCALPSPRERQWGGAGPWR